MSNSTITEKFQTTIPVDIRRALNLKPRQKISYELQKDGSVKVRPLPTVAELFGCMRTNRPLSTIAEEKMAVQKIMAEHGAKDT